MKYVQPHNPPPHFKNGEGLRKDQLRFSYCNREVLNVSKPGADCDFTIKFQLQRSLLCSELGRMSVGREKKGEQLTWRTAWDKKEAGEGWREVKPFNPSPAVPPVPVLDSCFSGLSYCHGFGKKSLFTGNKLAVLPTALLGWGGGRSWLF